MQNNPPTPLPHTQPAPLWFGLPHMPFRQAQPTPGLAQPTPGLSTSHPGQAPWLGGLPGVVEASWLVALSRAIPTFRAARVLTGIFRVWVWPDRTALGLPERGAALRAAPGWTIRLIPDNPLALIGRPIVVRPGPALFQVGGLISGGQSGLSGAGGPAARMGAPTGSGGVEAVFGHPRRRTGYAPVRIAGRVGGWPDPPPARAT